MNSGFCPNWKRRGLYQIEHLRCTTFWCVRLACWAHRGWRVRHARYSEHIVGLHDLFVGEKVIENMKLAAFCARI